VRVLLDHGSMHTNSIVNAADLNGDAPLHIVCKYGSAWMLSVLLPQPTIRINLKNRFSKPPLDILKYSLKEMICSETQASTMRKIVILE
jgi:ankyrin repeat protein